MPLTAGVTACPVPSLASGAFAGLAGDWLTSRAAGRDAAHGPAASTRDARETGASYVSNTFTFMKTFLSYSTKTLHKTKSLQHNGPPAPGRHATRPRRGTPVTSGPAPDLRAAEGELVGAWNTVLIVLKARGLEPSENEQRRVADCADLDQLRKWADAALTASSTGDVFG